MILAIDPGPIESAYVGLEDIDAPLPHITIFGKAQNPEVLKLIYRNSSIYEVAIEQIRSYGMPVGAEVLDTCVWSGRFAQMASHIGCADPHWLPRKTIVTNLCGSSKAKDKNVRQALIDRWGGQSAIGTKKAPGPLYGFAKDAWAALAVGVVFCDLRKASAL